MSQTFLSIASGPGIGLATARRFGRQGFRVVLAARNVERLHTAAARLRSEDIEATTVRVDASNAHSVANAVRSIGPELAVLHYNAGVLHYDAAGRLKRRTLQDETVDSLVNDTRINVSGAMAAAQAAAQIMVAQRRGSILLTGGGLGVSPSAEFLTLSVGKAAVRALTLALFPALKKHGVHVATVTVARLIAPHSAEADEVAETFWRLHSQQQSEWDAELTYPADNA